MGVLGLAGGLLAVTTALLPPAAEGSEALVLVTGAFAGTVGGLLLLRRPRLGELPLNAIGVLATALITIATHEGGVTGGTADNEILYLWVVLYGFYFLPTRSALFQLAVVGAAYGWLLSQTVGGGQAPTQWLVTMTTMTVIGFLAAQLRANLYRVVEELSERASHDSLTGLLNRGALDERVAAERSRALRDGTPLSVLAIDVDGLKELNDTLGHSGGDDVLQQVAATLEHQTRGHDAVARIGGDEFALLLPGTTEAAARVVAEHLREAVTRTIAGESAGVTVSVGVATGRNPIPPFDELLRAADEAMYAGKHAGGDRVCVSAARVDEAGLRSVAVS